MKFRWFPKQITDSNQKFSHVSIYHHSKLSVNQTMIPCRIKLKFLMKISNMMVFDMNGRDQVWSSSVFGINSWISDKIYWLLLFEQLIIKLMIKLLKFLWSSCNFYYMLLTCLSSMWTVVIGFEGHLFCIKIHKLETKFVSYCCFNYPSWIWWSYSKILSDLNINFYQNLLVISLPYERWRLDLEFGILIK